MKQHDFQLRMNCRYEEPDNSLEQIDIWTLIEGEWKALDINAKTPGFQALCYALFSCQHLYFRVNAAERGLLLDSAEGGISLAIDDKWSIQSIRVDFTGKVKSGIQSKEDIDYIIERMGHCPVSTNIKDVDDTETTVTLIDCDN